MSVTISNQPVVTLINTFTVKPEKQLELIEVLNEASEKVIKHLDGFISASIHRGIDGTYVANYAQWASKDHMLKMQKNPAAQEHMKAAAALSEKFEPLLYVVDSIHERD